MIIIYIRQKYRIIHMEKMTLPLNYMKRVPKVFMLKAI